VFRICYNFRIVGAWRNFCSQAHRNTTARYFLPIELSGNITIMYLENNLASKIQQSQHYTSERDVGGAVPYKRDRIVFVLSYNGCNRGLVSSTGERCSPLQICCRNFMSVSEFFYIQFSSCVRGVTLGIMPLVAYTQNTAMHTHALTQVLYSLFQNLSSYSLSRRACTCPQVSKRFLLIPKITTFVA
jgi:hypothetical protein